MSKLHSKLHIVMDKFRAQQKVFQIYEAFAYINIYYVQI